MGKLNLDGKVAIITGAGSGIGKASAILLAREGARVLVVDINRDSAMGTLEVILGFGGEAACSFTDVSNSISVQEMSSHAVAKWGRIDILFNNAAATELCNKYDRPVHLLDESIWDRMLNVTLKSVYLCSKFCLPSMIEQRSGSILNMVSIDAILSEPGFDSYTAAKGGIISLTRSMAGEYGKYGIRVNAISPGYIVTEVQQDWFSSSPSAVKWASDAHAVRRCGEPEEVAAAALFLCSDMASFITGAIVPVDGGYTAFKEIGADLFCQQGSAKS